MLKKKLSTLVVLLCALAVALIYSLDLKDDYYFHSTGKKSAANIEQIEKVQEYRPYVITLTYFNENTKKEEKCSMKLDGNFGSKLSQGNSVNVFYTEQNSCDLYIEGYKNPTKAGLVIHIIIFSVAAIASIIFLTKLLRKEKVD